MSSQTEQRRPWHREPQTSQDIGDLHCLPDGRIVNFTRENVASVDSPLQSLASFKAPDAVCRHGR